MEINSTKNIVSVNCEDSSSLATLTIINDNIVVATFKSNPDVRYTYIMPTTGNLSRLVECDSAGKFVASFVKPFASWTTKTTPEGVSVPL